MMGRSLGIFLYHFRRKLGVSQEEFAQTTGVSPVQLGKIERGEIDRPHQRTWKLIADRLGVTVDEIVRRSAAVDRLEDLIERELAPLIRQEKPDDTPPEPDRVGETDPAERIFGDF